MPRVTSAADTSAFKPQDIRRRGAHFLSSPPCGWPKPLRCPKACNCGAANASMDPTAIAVHCGTKPQLREIAAKLPALSLGLAKRFQSGQR